ncbi:MAG: hypothetical protein D6706_20620 [Chloroflexi bacterium]|nr:MAG: hypothetical protein D6706_20620 [Chloroflexota bacterium]
MKNNMENYQKQPLSDRQNKQLNGAIIGEGCKVGNTRMLRKCNAPGKLNAFYIPGAIFIRVCLLKIELPAI